MQLRREGEGRRSSRRFTSPTSIHLRLQVAPQGTPLPQGHSSQPPLFGSSPCRRPGDPAQPRRDLPLCCAARVPLAPRSRPAFPPRPAGMPGPGPQLSRVAWTRARDAPLSRPRPPLGLEDPCFLQSPHGSPRSRDAPAAHAPGSPSSPESARNSPVPPPPSPLRPRAGSALWAGGWAPASWSWPSGPCCLAERSLGPSTAPGSPRRRPPRPTRREPALTGRLPPLIGWERCYSPRPRPSRGFPAPPAFPKPRRALPARALRPRDAR